MPLKLKDAGAWGQLKRGDVPMNVGGSVVDVEQIWVKHNSVWHPMFDIIALGRWGYAGYAGPTLTDNGYTGAQDFIDALTTQMASNDDGETLTYFLPDDQTYAYFAHPKVLGQALFTDTGNNFSGAWDGATWLEDLSNMDNTGPIEVTYDAGRGPEQWYVYRTDWPGPNYDNQTFQVDYPNRPANS